MTDELSIQPQVIQKRNDNSGLIGATGALAGAAAGYGINRYVQKPMSHDDIIKDANANDRAEFSSKYSENEATWNEVKAKADEVKRLEAEANKTPEKVLAETEKEAIDLKKATEARDKEFAKLVEREKAKGGISRVTEFPTRKQIEENLTKSQLEIAEPYIQKYETAREKLIGVRSAGGGSYVGGNLQPYRDTVKALTNPSKPGSVASMYETFLTKYDRLSDRAKENENVIAKNFKRDVKSEVDRILPFSDSFFGKTNLNGIKEIQEKYGEEFIEILEEKPADTKGKWLKIEKNAKGKNVYVLIDKEALKARRESLVSEYLENIERYVEKANELKGLEKEFFEANKEALEELGYKTQASLSKLSKDLVDAKESLKSFEMMETGLKNGMIKYNTKDCPFKNADEFNKAKQAYEDLIEIGNRYIGERNAIGVEKAKIIQQDARVAYAKAQLRKAAKEDKGIQTAIKELEKGLNGKYATDEQIKVYEALKELMNVETTELSQSEIEAKVREMMKDGKYESDVAKFQAAYNKALEKKGVANDAGAKAAKEAVEKAKKELEEKAKALGQKMSKGGINPWLAAGIGAVALGLASFGISKSNQS